MSLGKAWLLILAPLFHSAYHIISFWEHFANSKIVVYYHIIREIVRPKLVKYTSLRKDTSFFIYPLPTSIITNQVQAKKEWLQ
jgi:hypothetical protein